MIVDPQCLLIFTDSFFNIMPSPLSFSQQQMKLGKIDIAGFKIGQVLQGFINHFETQAESSQVKLEQHILGIRLHLTAIKASSVAGSSILR